jgi:energy-coupling factor transporter ATP-binding protein EcfA2
VNLLVLDEPTNHLDIQTREVLLSALTQFDGTVILVSHDRHFLRAVSTRVFELDRGQMRIYEGGYGDYREWVGWSFSDCTTRPIETAMRSSTASLKCCNWMPHKWPDTNS